MFYYGKLAVMGTPVWDGLPSFMLCSSFHSITGVGNFIVHVPKSPAKVKAGVWEEIKLLIIQNVGHKGEKQKQTFLSTFLFIM